MNTTTRLWLIIALGLLIPFPIFAQTEGDALVDEGEGEAGLNKIDLIAENRPLVEVADEISQKAGVNIYVDSNIDENVNVKLFGVNWRTVLEIVARDTNCNIVQPPGTERVFILTQPPRVSMEFADAELPLVLDLLARQAGKNIVISPKVKGKITLTLKNVEWRKALDTIAKTHGYVVVPVDESLIRVVPPEDLEAQLETHVFKLRYLRPPSTYKARPPVGNTGRAQGDTKETSDYFVGQGKGPDDANLVENFTLAKALKEVIEQGRIEGERIQYNLESNSFIITATRPKIEEIRNIITALDTEPGQVFVDVKFITTRHDNFWKAGIKADDELTIPREGVKVIANNGADGRGSFFSYDFGESVDAFEEAFAIPTVLDFRQLQPVLQFIDGDDDSKVIQNPTLMTMNDKEAVIFVGDQVAYATQEAKVDPTGNITVVIDEAEDSPISVGFSLFITPHIVPDTDQILMSIIPRVSELSGETSPAIEGFDRFQFVDPTTGVTTFIDLPRTRDQAIVTELLIRDGNTAVIGGLISEEVLQFEQRTPILSDIPIVGNLFKFQDDRYIQENLLIFITPHIIRGREDAKRIFERRYQILQQNDWFYKRWERDEQDRPKATGAATEEEVETTEEEETEETGTEESGEEEETGTEEMPEEEEEPLPEELPPAEEGDEETGEEEEVPEEIPLEEEEETEELPSETGEEETGEEETETTEEMPEEMPEEEEVSEEEEEATSEEESTTEEESTESPEESLVPPEEESAEAEEGGMEEEVTPTPAPSAELLPPEEDSTEPSPEGENGGAEEEEDDSTRRIGYGQEEQQRQRNHHHADQRRRTRGIAYCGHRRQSAS